MLIALAINHLLMPAATFTRLPLLMHWTSQEFNGIYSKNKMKVIKILSVGLMENRVHREKTLQAKPVTD